MLRRINDLPIKTETQIVSWIDMELLFESDTPLSAAVIDVDPDIKIKTFTSRLEMILDTGDIHYQVPLTFQDLPWQLKFSTSISKYKKQPEEVIRLLCDRITSINDDEIIGFLKIKRRSVNAGHASIRILPKEDLIQVICKHNKSTGLKALWKSVFWRLDPQYKPKKTKSVKYTPTSCLIEEY